MGGDDKGFSLDDSAERLYQQLEGIDDTLRADVSIVMESELMAFLQQEEKKLDRIRILMSQAICTFTDIVVNSNPASLAKENNQKMRVFFNTLQKIAKSYEAGKNIFCRFRGQQHVPEIDGHLQGSPEIYDYELSLGDILLDCQVAQMVEKRESDKGRGLHANLMKAFQAMNEKKIFNFTIDIAPEGEGEDYSRHVKCFKYLVGFYSSQGAASFIVLDEYEQPSINLTLLAATNKVRSQSLQALVDKIKPQMLGPTPAPELQCYTTVYDVIVTTKRYRQKLKKMPIEVNNVHQLMLSSRPGPKRTAEAVQVSRLVLARYGSDPKKSAEIISSISSEGYGRVQTSVMGKRLSMATDFLDLAEGSGNKESLHNEALQNIEDGLDRVPDEIYDNISIENGKFSTVDDEGETTGWSLHEKLFGLVSFFKQRVLTRRKVRDINNKSVQFDTIDYLVIARNFSISEKEALHLVELLKGCFSESGRFRRSFFEKSIPEFVRYESKVFEFLWYYLKEFSVREDRVAFLNSIQILIGSLMQPQDALTVLLSDIFNPTAVGRFSDRNGLILGTILLRQYNKEEKSNVELTPEEVLFAREVLNEDMVRAALTFLQRNREQVLEKVRRLMELLLQPAAEKVHQEAEMAPRFLLSLMRELVVFFSLVGGKTAQLIVRGIAQEFGNPASPYYRNLQDKGLASQALKLLQIATRGLRRFDDPFTMPLLEKIADREAEFVALYDNPEYHLAVQKVMERIASHSD